MYTGPFIRRIQASKLLVVVVFACGCGAGARWRVTIGTVRHRGWRRCSRCFIETLRMFKETWWSLWMICMYCCIVPFHVHVIRCGRWRWTSIRAQRHFIETLRIAMICMYICIVLDLNSCLLTRFVYIVTTLLSIVHSSILCEESSKSWMMMISAHLYTWLKAAKLYIDDYIRSKRLTIRSSHRSIKQFELWKNNPSRCVRLAGGGCAIAWLGKHQRR